MAKAALPQTPRRSKRFQPIVSSPRKGSRSTQAAGASWCPGARPLDTRPLDASRDLLPEEVDAWNNEEDEENRENLETRFYDSYQTRKSAHMKRKTTKGKGKTESEFVTYKVGDTIFVETEMLAKKAPSIAVITGMWETDFEAEDTERIRLGIHWFIRPNELPSIRAKRNYQENEVFYSLSNKAIIGASQVIGPCTVQKGETPEAAPSPSKSPTKGRWTREVVPDSDDEIITLPSSQFQCIYAVESRRGIFYNFDWLKHRKEALKYKPSDDEWEGGVAWDAHDGVPEAPPKKERKPATARPPPRKKVKATPTKAKPRKPAKAETEPGEEYEVGSDAESEDSGEEYDHEDEEDEDEEDVGSVVDEDELDSDEAEGTASEDDDEGMPKTPSKKRKRKTALSTPRKPRGRATVQPTPHSKAALNRRKRSKSQGSPSKSPSKKKAFPVRAQNSFKNVDSSSLRKLPEDPWARAMHVLHVGSRPDTLPCRDEEFDWLLRTVSELVEEGSGGCVYISGVPGTGKTATVHAVIRELTRMAKDNETNPFTYCEINGLRIPEPSAAYNLLWESISNHDVAKEGHLKISAKESLKALTRHFSGGNRGPGGHACVVLMDELDQLVTTKQDVVYNFFNWPTLAGESAGKNFLPYKTLQLDEIVTSRLKCVKESLKADKQKDVIAPDGIRFAAMKIASVSGDARRMLDVCRRAVELCQSLGRPARTNDVAEIIKEMQNSPTAAYLNECSLHERIMLAALIKCVKREGVEEIKWSALHNQHLDYIPALTSGSDPTRRLSVSELYMVLESLVASRAMLLEDGLAASRKDFGERRVILNLEQTEVERVLGDVGGQTWKNLLGVGHAND
ncbi:hypothetical protein D9758_013297 [Tetrapyrgos nigripes]|uniref:Origin recognition complex subunit 1 n=1 Tax=Tetrapyrgos nigripes TaxID=182062 RepID=A0A8H5CCJ2_9AGAR|nr:hypothetical protein D9758_013297 [Tetrapyrgos nigripes]